MKELHCTWYYPHCNYQNDFESFSKLNLNIVGKILLVFWPVKKVVTDKLLVRAHTKPLYKISGILAIRTLVILLLVPNGADAVTVTFICLLTTIQ